MWICSVDVPVDSGDRHGAFLVYQHHWRCTSKLLGTHGLAQTRVNRADTMQAGEVEAALATLEVLCTRFTLRFSRPLPRTPFKGPQYYMLQWPIVSLSNVLAPADFLPGSTWFSSKKDVAQALLLAMKLCERSQGSMLKDADPHVAVQLAAALMQLFEVPPAAPALQPRQWGDLRRLSSLAIICMYLQQH